MKKILAILMFLPVFAGITSCDQELLETAPTEKVDGPTIFANINSAQVAMDGVYRLLFVSGWTDGNTHQNFGILSTNMFTSLMGEDFLQDQIGNGWFYFDYRYDVRSRFTSTNWRSYGTWNFYYTLINNVNYIIPQKETIIGDPVLVDNLIAQALTIRAYSYFQLIQIFQQTYKGHESFPGVPFTPNPPPPSRKGKAAEPYRKCMTRSTKTWTMPLPCSQKTRASRPTNRMSTTTSPTRSKPGFAWL